MQPAVITFRPDNFLTIGLIGLTMYLAAVAVTQGLMRAGWVKTPAAPASASPAPTAYV